MVVSRFEEPSLDEAVPYVFILEMKDRSVIAPGGMTAVAAVA